MMRSYPADSPQAAARLVVLAMLADGHLDRDELARAEALGVHEQLGLDRAGWHAVLHGFCEDLLSSVGLAWGGACQVDPATLQSLLAEVRDPALRERVLALCLEVAEADGRLTEGEGQVLAHAGLAWRLPLPVTTT